MSEPLIITLGCRLNAYESEVMRQHARSAAVEDCVIVNTCAVTAEAVRQGVQTIRKLRREHARARIVVTGCAAQIEPERFASMPEVDHVVGNGEKIEPETFRALSVDGLERVVVNDIMSVKETAGHMIGGFAAQARAFVQIQNGCNHRCTFCIIPFGRGPSRSVPAGDVVSQVRHLVTTGYGEVVLTGVDITSYGGDLPGGMTLGRLVKQILKLVPELARLRLSSIDQTEADAELLDAVATEPRLMPHLHLSLQAGDDIVLKRMKRRHTRADAIDFCNELRRRRPDIVFGADLIAGFPTETEDMFAGTLDLVDACGLTYLHVFPFSPRAGTPAARMPQVAGPEIKQRAARLRARGDAVLSSYLDGLRNAEVEILIENGGIGRTVQFAEVLVGQGPAVGSLQRVRTSDHDGRRLKGRVVT